MRSLIIYYSYSGVTDKVANVFAGVLKEKGEVKIKRLLPKDEIKGFLAQCSAARRGVRAAIADDIEYDVSPYDLVLIGSPVWAFKPTPAMNTYLDKLNGLHGKKVVVLLTSGSGIGVGMCFKSIRTVLESKGAGSICEINIPEMRRNDTKFIADKLRRAL